MKSLCIITGAYPPDICGVGDYTAKVKNSLSKFCQVEVFCEKDWRLNSFFRHVWFLRKKPRGTAFNMQSPTIGFEGKIWPYFLPIFLWPFYFSCTIHEYSRKSLVGKLLMQLIFLFSNQLIFTTAKEAAAACQTNPFIKNKIVIIPIGSNIPLVSSPALVRDIDVACFGLIRPGKGIETFLDTAEICAQQRDLRIALVGLVSPEFQDYFNQLQVKLKQLNVEVYLDLSDVDAAQLLTRVKCCLLPFPDGISLRRGSALAAMLNGSLVVSTAGVDTESQFNSICLLADTPEGLSASLIDGLGMAADSQIILDAKTFAASLSWDSIARQYAEVVFKE